MGTDEKLQSLRRRLDTHKNNLLKLEEQAATYGIDIPLYLSNQIDHEQKEIARVEEQIAQLKETRSSFTKVFKAAGPVKAIIQLVEATKVSGIEAKYFGCHTPGQNANIKLYIDEADVGLVRLKFIDAEEKTLGTISAELKAEQMALAESWWGELLRLLTEAGRSLSARSGIEGHPPSESVASLMREVERIQKIVDHNLQLKLDDTPQLVKKMPVTAFETAFGGERRLGVSERLSQAVADYLDFAVSINLLVDRYENQIRSGRGTDPLQIGVPGSSRSSYTIQQIQEEISKQELSEALEKLRIYLRGESRQAMD
jgi:hypothetical protein